MGSRINSHGKAVAPMCDQTSEKVDLLEAKFRAHSFSDKVLSLTPRGLFSALTLWGFLEKFFINVGHPHRDYETRNKKVPHIGKLAKSYTNVRNPPILTEFTQGTRSIFSSVCQCDF